MYGVARQPIRNLAFFKGENKVNEVQTHYAQHTLMYLAKLAADHDYEALRRFGLRHSQVEALPTLPARDFLELARMMRAHMSNITIDSDALEHALDVLCRHRNENETIEAMLSAGARFEMMSELFGLSNAEYASRRKFLKIPESRGRPKTPSEAEQKAIWRNWLTLETREPDETRRFLAVHRITGVPVGTIWRLIRKWKETGLAPALDERPDERSAVETI